jgi:hypothetical protein
MSHGDACLLRSYRVSKALKRVVTDPAFTPELVGKQSKAAMSMCMWVRAMDTYCTVFNVVEPKRRALEAAQVWRIVRGLQGREGPPGCYRAHSDCVAQAADAFIAGMPSQHA